MTFVDFILYMLVDLKKNRQFIVKYSVCLGRVDLPRIQTQVSGKPGATHCSSSEPARAVQRAQGAAGEGALTQLYKTSHPNTTCKHRSIAQLSAEHAPAVEAHTSRNHNSTAWDRNVFSILNVSTSNVNLIALCLLFVGGKINTHWMPNWNFALSEGNSCFVTFME